MGPNIEKLAPSISLKIDPSLEKSLTAGPEENQVVFIDGPQAGGKSTVATLLAALIDEKTSQRPTIINTDWALKPKDEYRGENYELWWRKNLLYGMVSKYLRSQSRGEKTVTFFNIYEHGTSDHASQIKKKLTVNITPITIVEGVLAISPELLFLVEQKHPANHHLLAMAKESNDLLIKRNALRTKSRHQDDKKQEKIMKDMSIPSWRSRENYIYQTVDWLFLVKGNLATITPNTYKEVVEKTN